MREMWKLQTLPLDEHITTLLDRKQLDTLYFRQYILCFLPCPLIISIFILLLDLLKALSSLVPTVIPAWQVYSPEFLSSSSASYNFTTVGIFQ